MNAYLTEAQSRAIVEGSDGLVQLIDPSTNRSYVLLPTEVYFQLQERRPLIPGESYPAIDRTFSEGWNHPKMDDYDRYDELKK